MFRNNWATTTLGNIVELATGKLDANAAKKNGKYPFFTCGRDVLRIDQSAFDQEAVLLAGNGDFNVKHYVGKFNAYQRTYVLRPLAVDGRFLFFLVSFYLPQITFNERGSTIRYIRRGDIEDTKIDVPPIPEQRRIVAKIDSLSAKSKRAREHLDHVPRLVEKYKQATLSATFNEEAFSRWQRGRLEDFVTDGLVGLVRSKDQQSTSTGMPYIRMNHLDMEGNWNNNDLSFVTVDAREKRRYELRDGDVLFNTRNSYELVGKVAVWPINRPGCVYNNNLLRLRFANSIDPAFAGLLMISPQFRSYLQSVKSATTSVCAIYQRSLLSAPFAFPPLDEQKSVVRRVCAAISYISRLASETTSARKLIDHLDQSVIAKAFRGELVPQDTNDEPASALLERIRTERELGAPIKRSTAKNNK